jgi:hypothetical protein
MADWHLGTFKPYRPFGEDMFIVYAHSGKLERCKPHLEAGSVGLHIGSGCPTVLEGSRARG